MRLGWVRDNGSWRLTDPASKELTKGKRDVASLTDGDFFRDLSQKGVDMKIALDIASLAYKKQVQQIVLISGDSDFVPAAKLARREGIDVILDPMWKKLSDDLYEHVDGIWNAAKKPSS